MVSASFEADENIDNQCVDADQVVPSARSSTMIGDCIKPSANSAEEEETNNSIVKPFHKRKKNDQKKRFKSIKTLVRLFIFCLQMH